jgi:hypothetical protein
VATFTPTCTVPTFSATAGSIKPCLQVSAHSCHRATRVAREDSRGCLSARGCRATPGGTDGSLNRAQVRKLHKQQSRQKHRRTGCGTHGRGRWSGSASWRPQQVPTPNVAVTLAHGSWAELGSQRAASVPRSGFCQSCPADRASGSDVCPESWQLGAWAQGGI